VGGLEKSFDRIAEAFLNRGFQVTLLTRETGFSHPDIEIVSCSTVSWPGFVRMEQFDRFTSAWLKKNRFDLVFGMDRNRFQTHYRAGNGVHLEFLKSRIGTEGKLKVAMCHLNPLHRKILSLEKTAFESPSLQKLFTNSHMVKQELLSHFSTPSEKIEVIHNGVEWHEMQSSFEGSSFSNRKTPFRFLFIGNGYLRKGLKPLLLALKNWREEEVELAIVGKENRTDAFKAIAGKNVTFYGERRDIRSFYQKADALVIPSFYDPFANVTVEALAMGLTVVSSKKNGGHEVLDTASGIIIEELTDLDSLRTSLAEAMKRPKERERAEAIRKGVAHLDFSKQLQILVDRCLASD
jgi:UDP-glucose:(heptosyl)LPS alpha-1,3-glucosyltransferase